METKEPKEPAPSRNPQALLERLKTDEQFFIELCLSVIDRKTNLTVPFKLNPVQLAYEKQKSNFDIILKARKLGFSTRIIASDIWACAFKQNQHALLISHDKIATVKLLEERVKPLLKSSTYPINCTMRRDHILFHDTNSRYYVGTAGTKAFGRGSDITRFHLSEASYYETPDIITGIENGCLEGAIGRIETTANGTNFFHKMWRQATAGNSRYKPIFMPWFTDPDYALPDFVITDLTEEEKKLVEAYGLTNAQIAWRRKKIKDMSQAELFQQEWPETSEAAFLSSGRMVFDWVSLLKHEARADVPKWRGFLRDVGEVVEFQPQDNGNLSIWETPEQLHTYVIGADVSEGLPDGAYSCAVVLDVNTSQQVAEWHGHIPPDRFADVLCRLGIYYNTALLVPESWPGPGSITQLRILDSGYRHCWLRPQRGNRTQPEQLYGWETTGRTRPQMLHSLGAALRDYAIVIRSRALLDEMRSIIYDDGGDMVAQLGCFSDRVMAAGIAWAVSREIAHGLHSGKPRLREIEAAARGVGAVSVPKWRGPRYGVKGE